MPEPSLHFHEDDYCGIELLPRPAWQFCADEMKALAEFSAAHSDGIGFTDIYVRKPAPYRLGDIGLNRTTLARIVGRHLPIRHFVTTGYVGHLETASQTIGFGETAACCIFADFDDRDMVQNAWLQLRHGNSGQHESMRAALASLAEGFDLIVADWERKTLLVLADHELLSRHLAARLSPAA